MDVFLIIWKNTPFIASLLFIISTLSIAIFLERMSRVKRSKLLPKNWQTIKRELLNRHYDVALAILQKDKRYLSQVLVELIELYLKKEISKGDLIRILEDKFLLLYGDLQRGISFISLSVTLATLLGLMGTVWGLIEIFSAYGLGSSDSLKLLAKGIATSLNSTAAGLLIAVINYILYWLVKERINSVYLKTLKEVESVFNNLP